MKKTCIAIVLMILVLMLIIPSGLAEDESKSTIWITMPYLDGAVIGDEETRCEPEIVGVVGNLAIARVPTGTEDFRVFTADALYLGVFDPEFPQEVVKIEGLAEIEILKSIYCSDKAGTENKSEISSVNLTRENIISSSPFLMAAGNQEVIWLTANCLEGTDWEYYRYYNVDNGDLELPAVGAKAINPIEYQELKREDIEPDKPVLWVSRVDWPMLWSEIEFTSSESELLFRDFLQTLAIEISEAT